MRFSRNIEINEDEREDAGTLLVSKGPERPNCRCDMKSATTPMCIHAYKQTSCTAATQSFQLMLALHVSRSKVYIPVFQVMLGWLMSGKDYALT